MKYVGCTLALLWIPVLLFANWVGFPLSNQLSGLEFSIFAYASGHIHPTLASHGAIAALLLLVAADGFRRERWKQIYYMGAGLLLLIFSSLLQVAFSQPHLLMDLAEEADWLTAANQFVPRYLPVNVGPEPTVWPLLYFDTLADRLFSGWYFMGLGWYLGLIGAITLIVVGVRNMDSASRRRAAAAIGAGILILALGFSVRPLLGEHTLTAALRAQAEGHPGEAKQLYRKAMRIDGWNALDLELYERIGSIDAALGRNATPEYRIYNAETMVEREQWLPALTEYEVLASTGGPLGATAAQRAANLWTEYGLQLYQDGAFGAAVNAWQRALIHRPSMWLAAFYLSRAYFAVGRYQEAVSLGSACLDRVSDPVFLANLYSNVGDAHTRQGDLARGHLQYSFSYYWDYVLNTRGLCSLAGPSFAGP